jgi:hypothetical protein
VERSGEGGDEGAGSEVNEKGQRKKEGGRGGRKCERARGARASRTCDLVDPVIQLYELATKIEFGPS